MARHECVAGAFCFFPQRQLVEPVERRHFVALGHRGVVEHRVAEVVDRAAERHHGLADVDDLGGRFADHVHAEQLARFAMEQQLEHARCVAGDLAAGDLAEAGDADFVRHALGGELLLVLADHRDFGNREQAVRHVLARLELAAQHVAGGPAALLHRRAGQCGEADHVAHRVDVRHVGLKMFVALEPAAVVGLQAGAVELQSGSVSPTRPTLNSTVSPSSRLPLSSSTATQARLRLADIDDAFAQPEDHAQRAGVVQQRVDDFVVAEFEQLRAAVDDGHLHAERGEHDGVFEADHAAADDDHRPRHVGQVENFVGVEDRFAVERNVVGPRRPRAGGEQDVLGLRTSAVRRGRRLRCGADRRTTPRRRRRRRGCGRTGPG